MTLSPLVVIIIVVWNNLRDTIECLSSLEDLDYSNYQIIVVDNGSTDQSFVKIKEEFPFVRVVRNEENLGYSGGCNVGLEYARKELDPSYFLILNNDTIVRDRNVVNSLVEIAENCTSVGIVAPLVFDYYNPHLIQSAGVSINLSKARSRHMLSIPPTPIRSDAVHGCAFMIKRKVIDQIGGLDDQFYLYWEETDYCLRLRQAGYQILIDPGTRILHKSGRTIGGRGALYTYYFFRNRLLLMHKHANPANWIVFFPLIPIYACIHVFNSVKEGNSWIEVTKAIMESWSDYWKGKFGKRGG
jgi:GT2 family glycosyltransferase